MHYFIYLTLIFQYTLTFSVHNNYENSDSIHMRRSMDMNNHQLVQLLKLTNLYLFFQNSSILFSSFTKKIRQMILFEDE